ncbi:MAG: 23S rRNA pseudouridine(1911/1915/1917) synthase RluD [Candidatus Thiodiazotropha sp. (ex Myrtea spinifera)]|nr:23S rRNA pseudouridine(1911/1915/1917) synthase RluD [Candidatus Thiodiazotropha sp. (ex Myrtea spinifera)]MCU7829067.1 23S rRNA pseudouridine(1911/1915/1917) synthase RluD [Candidatus Thiodiazotropha sp. (ex Myrtea sp. 'scaly one' KF741663)]
MTSDAEQPPEVQPLELRVPEVSAGVRLDQLLSEHFSEYSRSRLQRWIKLGHVLLDGCACRAKDKVRGGELVVVRPILEAEVSDLAEDMALDIVYEDEALLVVNKPAGMVVHPAAGNPNGTLLNGLLGHHPPLEKIPRAGIVHRLDKETSGLLVVAKTLPAQNALVQQLQARSVKREYRAVVQGVMTAGGRVDAPIARHPVNRLRMAVIETGKPAVTHYRVLQRYRAHTYVKVNLETGRTHQIRVHMAHIHFPLVGDPLYGGRLKLPSGACDLLVETLRDFRRQALHAMRLALVHPESGETLTWEAPLPEDMQHLIEALEMDMIE